MLVLSTTLSMFLVGGASLAAARWGSQIGGVFSAIPIIVGAVLLDAAHSHGSRFAAELACSTLLGLVGFSAFTLAYAYLARSHAWPLSLIAAWVPAAALSGLVGVSGGPLLGVTVASAALGLAYVLLPHSAGHPSPTAVPAGGLALQTVLAGTLVASLPAFATAAGARLGGIAAALPVVASVVLVLAHRNLGAQAVNATAKGMLAGMGGFLAFCAIIAATITTVGPPAAFASASCAALALQGAVLLCSRRSAPSRVEATSLPIAVEGWQSG